MRKLKLNIGKDSYKFVSLTLIENLTFIGQTYIRMADLKVEFIVTC